MSGLSGLLRRWSIVAVVVPILLLGGAGCSWLSWVEIRAALQGVTAAEIEATLRTDTSVVVKSLRRATAVAAPGGASHLEGFDSECDVGGIALQVSVEAQGQELVIRACGVNQVLTSEEAARWRACVDRLGATMRAAHPSLGPWTRDEEVRDPAARGWLLQSICCFGLAFPPVVAAAVLWLRRRRRSSAAASAPE